ncbi:hypothetical protein [Streptomyces tauricus]|uniref:hypothetical protein n=1 Tax=Streptomyces tauricus TaxID=68274 RepID=UPI0034148DF3
MTDRIPLHNTASPETRLRLAHEARRAKEHQLDDIRRALCDVGLIQDDDPYSHADLADVIRQALRTEAGYCPSCGRGDVAPTADEYEQQRQRAEKAEAAITRLLNWADELDKTTRGVPPEATHPVAGHIRHRIGYDPRKES